MNKFLLISFAFVLVTACNKEPGVGGQAVIRGKVWVEYWNQSFTNMTGAGNGSDRDVYLIYGEDVTYSQRVKASHDGTYQFAYLTPGSYTVYAYSEDSTLQSPSGSIAILMDTVITDKAEVVDMPWLKIFD